MSKELEYEVNNFANLLNKDCMNLMECLKKQGEDNKPILYLGKHYKKVILPYEEYQKMYKRLEAIDNANPSEALECLESIKDALWDDDFHYQRHSKLLDTIEQALLKAQEPKQYVDELKLVEKKLKALEIIKEKDVDICELKICIDEYDDSLYQYNKRMNIKLFKLTEEEFSLLKEILE